MELQYAHLADFAAQGEGGKITIVGIFDIVFTREGGEVVLPPMFLAASFRAHVAEGSVNTMEIRFADGEGVDMMPRAQLELRFAHRGPRHLMQGNMLLRIDAGLKVPGEGDYAFHFFQGNTELGEVPLSVVRRPSA